jgi:hypothetical protein
MDTISDYRISSLIADENELAARAERVRVAAERAALEAPTRALTSTGSLPCAAPAH